MVVLLLYLLKFIHSYIENFSQQVVSEYRFDWEQWLKKKERRQEKFDGTDFGYWKMQIEDYLYGKKLHLPLLGSKPDSMEEEE